MPGTVKEVFVKVGDNIAQGANILSLSVSANAEIKQEAPAETEKTTNTPLEEIPEVKQQSASISAPPEPSNDNGAAPQSKGHIHASPSVRRFARELGVDVTKITKASGPKNRILKEDVKQFVKQSLSKSNVQSGSGIPAIPAVDFTKFGEIEERPLGRIKKLTAINLTRSWLNVPMVTHHDVADITEMEDFRQSFKGRGRKKRR